MEAKQTQQKKPTARPVQGPVQQEKKTQQKPRSEQSSTKQSMQLIAVILVRGTIRSIPKVRKTLELLRLHRTNYCTLLPATQSNKGMLQAIKDYATWGEINEETLKSLKNKHGEQKYYRLNPPRKGYGRKGIKTAFKKRGALGNRGEKINDLLTRML